MALVPGSLSYVLGFLGLVFVFLGVVPGSPGLASWWRIPTNKRNLRIHAFNDVLTMAKRDGFSRSRGLFVAMIRERIYLKGKQRRSHYLSNYILFPSNVYNVDIDISIFSFCVSQTHF